MEKGKILVIDANDKIRTLVCTHLSSRFEVMGVRHGVEAAELMRRYIPDLLLIDQDVPVGGIRTARILRLHPDYQQIPVLIGLMPEKANIVQQIKEGEKANLKAYIAKPYTLSVLEKKIEENINLKLTSLTMAEVREELKNLTNLPVLSPVHQKMMRLLSQEDDEIPMRELTRTIESDPGMVAAIMRICRSAYFGFRGNTIPTAITFLGMKEIRKVVQASVLFDVFKADRQTRVQGEISLMDLWRHSVACGVIMEWGQRHIKGRDHFIAGIMHDIGKIILLLRFPEHFQTMVRIARKEQKTIFQVEKELLGITHTDIGYELVNQWDLPSTISNCISFHHNPSVATIHKRFVSLANVGDIMARRMEIGNGGDDQQPEIDEYAKRIFSLLPSLDEKRDEIIAQVESIVPLEEKDSTNPKTGEEVREEKEEKTEEEVGHAVE